MINPITPQSQLATGLGLIATLVGFVIALSVLAGDAQGRVNLLYLLTLFAFLPVTALILSAVFVCRGSSRGLAGWLLELPWWPRHWYAQLLSHQDRKKRKYWLFYQTQVISLGFGMGGLMAFLIQLLGTDVSFVWRSTLLEAPDILPVLQILAIPWAFWQGAQPTLELLQLSQDFRLGQQGNTAVELGRWWTFVLAAQCTYNLLPRAILLMVARHYYRNESVGSIRSEAVRSGTNPALNSLPEQGELAPVISAMSPPFVIIELMVPPPFVHQALIQLIERPIDVYRVNLASLSIEPELTDLKTGIGLLVLVKSWEPPLGELHDCLADLMSATGVEGVILPLDWDERELRPVSEVHLAEWRRFATSLSGWRVLHLPQLANLEVSS